jgi:hypothetical protein
VPACWLPTTKGRTRRIRARFVCGCDSTSCWFGLSDFRSAAHHIHGLVEREYSISRADAAEWSLRVSLLHSWQARVSVPPSVPRPTKIKGGYTYGICTQFRAERDEHRERKASRNPLFLGMSSRSESHWKGILALRNRGLGVRVPPGVLYGVNDLRRSTPRRRGECPRFRPLGAFRRPPSRTGGRGRGTFRPRPR